MNIEIARSYGEKISLGNYCMADFFASAKCEVDMEEADQKSKELYEFCRSQVKRDIEEYKENLNGKKEVKEPTKEYEKPLFKLDTQGVSQEVKELKFDDIKLQ